MPLPPFPSNYQILQGQLQVELAMLEYRLTRGTYVRTQTRPAICIRILHIFLLLSYFHSFLPSSYFTFPSISVSSRLITLSSFHSIHSLLILNTLPSSLPFFSQYLQYLHLPTPLPPLLCASHSFLFSHFSCSTRKPGPKASGGEGDKGCGFRGPGETKMETDKRAIREKIVLLTREISLLGMQREQHRRSRYVQYCTT